VNAFRILPQDPEAAIAAAAALLAASPAAKGKAKAKPKAKPKVFSPGIPGGWS
jgi:hypothetical protein